MYPHPFRQILNFILENNLNTTIKLVYLTSTLLKLKEYRALGLKAKKPEYQNFLPGDFIGEIRTIRINNTYFPCTTKKEFKKRKAREQSENTLFESGLYNGGTLQEVFHQLEAGALSRGGTGITQIRQKTLIISEEEHKRIVEDGLSKTYKELQAILEEKTIDVEILTAENSQDEE